MFKPDEPAIENSFIFSRRAVANSLLDKLKKETPKQSTEPLYERLNLLKHWR
jgi:ATP-dependent Clp protease protease subunit